jgi:hypothetical protein
LIGTITISVTLSDSNGTFLIDPADRQGTVVGSDTTSLTVSGLLSQVNADLGQLKFSSDTLAFDHIAYSVDDGVGGKEVIAAADGTRVYVNAPPVLTVPTGGQVVQQGVDTEFHLAVADADAPLFEFWPTVTLISAGQLSFDTSGGASLTYNAQGEAVLNGTLDQLNAALDHVHYRSSTVGPDSIEVKALDPVGATDDKVISIEVHTSGPVISAPDTLTLRAGSRVDLYPDIQ